MAKPTVKGSPHFNTAGYYVHIRVKIENDIPAPAPGDPPVQVNMVRVWGQSQMSDKACIDTRKTSQSKIEDSYLELPWDSDADWLDHWFLYDDTDKYYRISVEVSLSDDSPRLYKSAVWKIPSTGAGSITLADTELKDC